MWVLFFSVLPCLVKVLPSGKCYRLGMEGDSWLIFIWEKLTGPELIPETPLV